MDIFELMYEKYKLPNNPKLFEAFAGVGMQRMAFNRLGLDYEMVGISEIDKYAISSYMAIHGETKNFGSIMDIKGSDLPQIDVFTYSFPCTDLSKAGHQKGMSQNTRSGLVYEVLRILHELDELGKKPKVLIMENVIDLVQAKFIKEFQDIQLELEQLGYSNYTETLNAKDYGVAQNRDRVFMVSILGDYYYEFPKPFKLEKRLNDYLEKDVEDKYYLSKEIIESNLKRNIDQELKGNGFRFAPRTPDDIGRSVLTIPWSRPDDNFIIEPIRLCGLFDNDKGTHQAGSIWDKEALSPTIDTMQGGYRQPLIFEESLFSDLQKQMITEKNRFRIRKLTPKECWRLMGIDDEDFDKASKINSNAQLYKQAGNGIVVDVFAYIIKNMC